MLFLSKRFSFFQIAAFPAKLGHFFIVSCTGCVTGKPPLSSLHEVL